MKKEQFALLPILSTFLFITINTCFCQQHFRFTFKKGMKLHYRGSFDINSRLDKPDPSIHDTIKDFVVSIDSCITMGEIEYVRFHSSGINYYDKLMNDQLNIFFCNEQGKDLLLYKGQLFQLKTSNGFYEKYLSKDVLLKKLLDSTELQDSYDDLTVFSFIDPSNKRSCETYKTSPRRTEKTMENEFYCLSGEENVQTQYGNNVKVFEKHNWASLNSPNSYYYYSDNYFISKFVRNFNIPGMRWAYYELSLYKIDN